jgi:hypothetical protein
MMFMMPIPADQQADGRDSREQAGQHTGDPGQHRGDLLHVEDVEIVFLERADPPPLPHQAFNVGLGFLRGNAVADRGIDHRHVLVARYPPLEGPDRYQDDVILIGAETRGSLDFENTDHPAGDLLEPDAGADRIAIAEQFLAHGFAENAGGGAGSQLAFIKRAAS